MHGLRKQFAMEKMAMSVLSATKSHSRATSINMSIQENLRKLRKK